MKDSITCYFCGRTNDEVKRFIKEALLSGKIERMDNHRFEMLQNKFDQDFFIKMIHIQIPIGRRKANPMHQKSGPLKAIEKIMSTYNLSFDEAFYFLKRSSEILQPIIDNRYKYSNDAARKTAMMEALNTDEEIIIDVDQDVLKNLVESYKHVRGQSDKYDALRKEFYLPDNLKVPICYVCKSTLEMVQPEE